VAAIATGPEAGSKVICSVCNGTISGTVWVLCARCEVPIHKGCWEYAGQCPIYGCASREWHEPVELLLRPRAAVQIDNPSGGVAAPTPPSAPVPAKSPEERAAVYLSLDRRREELELRLRDLERRAQESRYHVPGGWALGPVILLMFLEPGAWNIWLGILGFAMINGVIRQLKLRSAAPGRDEILRVRDQIRALEHFQVTLLPPGSRSRN
jgi:hypothetical protein